MSKVEKERNALSLDLCDENAPIGLYLVVPWRDSYKEQLIDFDFLILDLRPLVIIRGENLPYKNVWYIIFNPNLVMALGNLGLARTGSSGLALLIKKHGFPQIQRPLFQSIRSYSSDGQGGDATKAPGQPLSNASSVAPQEPPGKAPRFPPKDPLTLEPRNGIEYVTTTVDKLMNWAHGGSIWPMTFGLACCAVEMMHMAASRYASIAFRPFTL